MMYAFVKRALFIGLMVIAPGACSHTKEVESGSEASKAAKPEKQDNAATSSTRAKPASRGRGNDDVPLASDPLRMLTPEGQKALREELKRRDLLQEQGSVPAALRKFQASQGIPETGMPDDETLKRLGLDPNDVVVRVRPAT
ncbi:MAG: peptidoglycan-binding domain-containing protein [Deltaproteobacteria bacterium]|nr:peptidoglycan-binding domain-containing protein [Deltaproteobacteria bacterium]